MDPLSFSIFRKFLHKCIVFIFFSTLGNKVLSLDSKFKACAPRSCGNGPYIGYPFWIHGEQDSFCGYPNFEITCNESTPILNISDINYIIKNISYLDHSFVVVNDAVYEETCPAPLQNITLHRTPFNLSSDNVDFSFFYNCTEEPDYPTYSVSCAGNASFYSFAVFHKDILESNYSIESCQSFVDAPVYMGNNVNFSSLLETNYTEILKSGFVLNWTAHSCSQCESSGGRCGYDNNEFICFCQDKPHSETCNDGNS